MPVMENCSPGIRVVCGTEKRFDQMLSDDSVVVLSDDLP